MRYLITYCYIALCCTPAEECGYCKRKNVFEPLVNNVIPDRKDEEDDDDQTTENQDTSGNDSASRQNQSDYKNKKGIDQEAKIDQEVKLLYSYIDQGEPDNVLSLLQRAPKLIDQEYQNKNVLISVLEVVQKENSALIRLVQYIMDQDPNQALEGLPTACPALQLALNKGFKESVRCIAFAKKDDIPVLHYCIMGINNQSSSIEVLKLVSEVVAKNDKTNLKNCKATYASDTKEKSKLKEIIAYQIEKNKQNGQMTTILQNIQKCLNLKSK